jgi:hypothetical protein
MLFFCFLVPVIPNRRTGSRSQDRVTGLGDFSPIGGDCLLWAVFLNYRSSTNFRATFSTYGYALILTKKWVGLHFGELFHETIWSPCLRSSNSFEFQVKNEGHQRKVRRGAVLHPKSPPPACPVSGGSRNTFICSSLKYSIFTYNNFICF